MILFIRLTALTILIFVISLTAANAQQAPPSHSLSEGANALQFQVTNGLSLDSFYGTALSFKKQLSNARANRIGITFQNNYSWTTYPDSEQDSSGISLNFALNYTWMNYVNPDHAVKFYYGYGPEISLSYRRASEFREIGGRSINKGARYGISGLAFTGIEWFFQSSLSLHAEYIGSLLLYYSNNKLSSDSFHTRHSQKGITLSGNGVRVGISAYF